MPTLRQLDYLLAVADIGHFGRAARAVRVSQPTLSQQLQALEARLGVTLVERRLATIQLTPVGREIAERARRIAVEVRDIEALARQASEGAVGTIRLGVTPTLGPYLLPTLIAALRREFPHLRLYVREGIPDEQQSELARGALDILLSPMPVPLDGLIVEPLFREPLRIVAPLDHPLVAAGATVTPDRLKGASILTLDARHHFHRQVAALCDDYAMTLLRDYEGTSLDSLRQMVASGLGLAVLPELYLRAEALTGSGLGVVHVTGWKAMRSIAAAWRIGAAWSDTYAAIAERVRHEAVALLGAA